MFFYVTGANTCPKSLNTVLVFGNHHDHSTFVGIDEVHYVSNNPAIRPRLTFLCWTNEKTQFSKMHIVPSPVDTPSDGRRVLSPDQSEEGVDLLKCCR